ncbi:hypothetical protein K7432_006142 [Basidiobolus ranarum]|uniref:Glutathione S-transferase n=1 Tax=Basidiobolus ranarum TaxID=34480 RepID=A0ABR2WVH8_9FUNG
MSSKSPLGSTPKLIYFELGAKGRGENIRVLLQDAGIQYEEERIPYDDQWPALSKQLKATEKNPVGSLPILELNGENYFGTVPLLRYIAGKLGTHKGRTLEEDLFIDSVSDFVVDWRASWAAGLQSPKDRAQHVENELPGYLDIVEKLLGKHEGPFALNDNFTYADIMIYQIVHDEEILGKLERYPHLKQLQEAVEARPRLVQYFAKRE